MDGALARQLSFGMPPLAAALLWLQAIAVAAFVIVFALGMVPEDTFFYFQIAANIVAGQGVTFHGYTPTNGFHPLWLAVVTGLHAIAQDRALLPHLVMATVVALALAGFWLTVAAARRLGLRYGYLGLAVLVPYALFTQIGSESALVVPLVALALWLFARFAESGRSGDFALLHLALALSVLARLDTVFVAGLLGVSSLIVCLRRHGVPRTAIFLLAPATIHVALLGGYLAWNLATTGHLMPISGALKGGAEHADAARAERIATMGWAALAAIAASAAALPFGAPRWRAALAPLYAGVALHAAYLLWFASGTTTWAWYYGAWMVAAALAFAHLATAAVGMAARHPHGRAAVRLADLAIPGLAVALPAAWFALHLPVMAAGRDAGWAKAYVAPFKSGLPDGSGIFVFDYPGALAFLGGYRVLPADGLVSDYRYQHAVRSQGILAYLRANGIRYVMAPGPDLDAAMRRRYCGVVVHKATRLGCRATPDGGAEAVDLTVYASLFGMEVGTVPLPRERLALTIPSMGFGVWRID